MIDFKYFSFTIVCSVCCSTLVWSLIFQGTFLLRFIYGPLPPLACFWHFLLRKALVNQLLLLFDGIILMQYIFIFWVKNPATFQDEFWNLFLNLWVVIFSFIYQATWTLMPGPQPLHYYFCTGQDPTLPFQQPQKVNGVLEILSLAVLTIVQVKIHLYNKSNRFGPLTHSDHLKKKVLSEIESQSFANFLTNIFGLFICSLNIIPVAVHNFISIEDLMNFPFLIYFGVLFVPSICSLSIPAMYIVKHKELRENILKNMKKCFCFLKK